MRLINLNGRASVLVDSGALDVHALTNGDFGPDAASCLADWQRFLEVVERATLSAEPQPYDVRDLGAPVPEPRQIFAIGLNYADHARETGLSAPDYPIVFTKFVTSLSGPVTSVVLPSDNVDYEAELVVVVGKNAHAVDAGEAWDYVAGLMVGQDLSEREVQTRGGASAQWSLGKSLPGFSPCGPALVSLDEIENRENLAINCRVGDEVLQDSKTSELIFTVPALVSYLSHILPLLPGDLIFTGTPDGVGIGRTPTRYLRAGETLITEIAGLGRLETKFV
ncbi:fumarylacetoacetate hydrolase family protein [Rhodococcus qingshengii]|uniref:fumarylacetoacetate hydrolase family protein n=1 Tax=Rhodococcus qingshengii TaxID=334542 RepID=UPI001BE52775|nr:fumarylacetoacetate hydrolase family protein [Rhodococcus qingshengii]MBT2276275.1 fumarylacetoacetate hydrolase family protein [Rhodococcus qingshengii]